MRATAPIPTTTDDEADSAASSRHLDAEDLDLSDLLQELRILLQGAQVLSAFLIILPFSEGFGRIDQVEKWIYLVTFVSSLVGLVFISAPAAQHRVQRPLRGRQREQFKHFATGMILVGMGAISVSLTLAAQLVANEVVGFVPSIFISVTLAVLIGIVWWLLPLRSRHRA